MHHHANSKQSMKRKHADSTRSNITKDEQAVQDLCACTTEIKCDPLDQINKSLCSLQSSIPASETLAAGFKSAKVDGVQILK